ncbi:conserved hypothetical protein [Hahella chejuensis KCTC 2396]|uniref:Uncharacterized protein n=1 Tax=Hahella chejuensis (strain KCTC 2396) TaxID=349521 RepID=Q2SDY9_HAHCH|nr:hypothetical protein [Hahella chejuensis]ABC31135.1 conserved hypothetical protein [Hahella chejuensis KCTC 2396]
MADNKSLFLEKAKSNTHELYVMTVGEFREIAEKINSGVTIDNVKTAAGFVAPTNDLITVKKVFSELGAKGRAVEKVINGERYIIIKGYAGFREVIKGTKYLSSNPTIISMAIGRLGVEKSIVQGAKLTVVLTVPISVIKYLVDEQRTLSRLIGTIASDLVKLGISSVFASAAAVTIGTLTTIAAGPLLAAVVVGVAVSIFLEHIDDEFGLTDALVKLIDDSYDNTVGVLDRILSKFESIFVWQAKNGVPLGKDVFY